MISMRFSPTTEPNHNLRPLSLKKTETNRQWLKRIKAEDGVILIGGTSLADFRVRVAQAHLRGDLLPSYWSLAGVLLDAKSFVSVPLDLGGDVSNVPRTNGVQTCRLEDYDDPRRYPNIAVVRFTDKPAITTAGITQVEKQRRSIIDIPNLILPWLGYVWGVSDQGNPLREGVGVPSAVLVETLYGIAGIELTPGLSSASSCPEAIWQSAKWWHNFYEQTSDMSDETHAGTISPTGHFALGQRSAAVVEFKD
jgi:hypothetical protein